MDKVNIGLYGENGHQIQAQLVDHPLGRCVATAAIPTLSLPDALRADPELRQYQTLDEMLEDDRIDLISLCSPYRHDQAEQAIHCLEAGKNVYAEKPCAMEEDALDAILNTAARTGHAFHEMAGTAFTQPYLAMRELVRSGTLGTIVQVLAQKSYPYHDNRPQNEDVDGGLLMQVGVHTLRFVEHVTGVRVKTIHAIETELGNPESGDLKMATAMMMTLENRGNAAVICNYLNPPAFGRWGNESLRIFGTQGFVEAVDGGTQTRLVLKDEDRGPLEIAEGGWDYLDLYLKTLLGVGEMPLSLEAEVHPTRMVIRAKADAMLRAR